MNSERNYNIMSFINESLTESDKRFIESFKFRQPLWRDKLADNPEDWSVDKERKFFLICLGGQGELFDREYPPNYYRLIIDNKVIKIEAYFKSEGNHSTGVKMTWRIESIIAPKVLKNKYQETLVEIIKEAFTCYGNIHKNGHVIYTTFNKIASPFYADE